MRTTLKAFLFKNQRLNVLLVIFILLGFATRLFHFFYNRSLWMDEVYLSSSLIKMNYSQLITGPLDYQQKAPIGFLLFVKFFVNLFGKNEISLRLFPLICGFLSTILFVPIAKYFLKDIPAILAVGILCLSPAIIYHSVEIKQYSTELLGTILCFNFLIKYKDRNEIKDLFTWGILGSIILWFSYSSIFILAGFGIGLSLIYLIKKEWKIFFVSLIPFSLWLLSFVLNYFLFTHKHAESQWIAYWFRAYQNFMPFPPKSVEDVKWFATNLYRMMDYPLGLLWNFSGVSSHQALNMVLKMPFLPIILLGLGIFAFFKRNASKAVILLVPIVLMFLASGIELYPLTERFWVFISPVFIIFIASGLSFITDKFKLRFTSFLLFILLLIGPLTGAISSVIYPENFYSHKKSFQRESLQFINERYKINDAVYIYWNDLPGYKLYKKMYNFRFTAIEGTDLRLASTGFVDYYQKLNVDFNKFSNNKRVWVVYNTQFLTDIGDKIDEPKWYYEKKSTPTQHLINEFLKTYKPIKIYRSKDVTVYLLERK